MILLLHIIVALISIFYGAITALSPSIKRLKVSYALAGSTLASGVLLVAVKPSALSHACVTGIIFFSIIGYLLITSRKSLAKENIL